jgi:hypothetical protein
MKCLLVKNIVYLKTKLLLADTVVNGLTGEKNVSFTD